MTNHVSLMTGLLVGFAIAVPIGPMGLLCIQRTLAGGMVVGVSTGLGAATVNVVYGAVILLGLGALTPWIAGGTRLLSALGGLFLLWSAVLTLWRGSAMGVPSRTVAPSPLTAYASAVAFNATNPMSLILILSLLSPVVRPSALAPIDAAVVLLGMFTAASAWWVCLSGGVALVRTRLNPSVLAYVNCAAGLLLTIYGALALIRSVQM